MENRNKLVWRAGNMLYPVPAVMVSCQKKDEKPNIITVAWAGTVNSDPAMVSISVRPSRFSHEIIETTGEFVINLTTEDLIRACDFCGVKSGRDTDKFKEMHLTPGKAEFVSCPLIEESPVNIECRVEEKMDLGTHTMFIARVLAVQVDEKYVDRNGVLRMDQMGLVSYSHGEYYKLGKRLGRFGFSVKKNRGHKNDLKKGNGKRRSAKTSD